MEVEDDFPFNWVIFVVPILQGLNLNIGAFDDLMTFKMWIDFD